MKKQDELKIDELVHSMINDDKKTNEFLYKHRFGQYTYRQLLSRDAWRLMRKSVLQRDNSKCTLCGSTHNLHVHHKYYIDKNRPWEYDKKALVTLCQSCHRNIHSKNFIPIYNSDPEKNKAAEIINLDKCNRCGGKGYIQQFNHVEDGICFSCWGTGYKTFYMRVYSRAEILRFMTTKIQEQK